MNSRLSARIVNLNIIDFLFKLMSIKKPSKFAGKWAQPVNEALVHNLQSLSNICHNDPSCYRSILRHQSGDFFNCICRCLQLENGYHVISTALELIVDFGLEGLVDLKKRPLMTNLWFAITSVIVDQNCTEFKLVLFIFSLLCLFYFLYKFHSKILHREFLNCL